MNIQKAFGFVLKQIREEQKISQEKFALKIEMDRTYYASIEAGKRNVSLINIKKISEGFQISLSELFQRVDILLSSKGEKTND